MFSSQCGAAGVKGNSGIGVRDFAALEFMKELILEPEYGPDKADSLAADAFIYANAFMAQKENNR